MMIAMFLFSMFVVAGENPAVRFLENPEVAPGREVYLRDIATIEVLEGEDHEEVAGIKVAGSLSQFQKMTTHEIMRQVKPGLKNFEERCECKVSLTVPSSIKGHAPAGLFSIEKARDVVLKRLAVYCADCEYKIDELKTALGSIPETYAIWEVNIQEAAMKGASMVQVYFDEDSLNPLVLQTLVTVKKPVLKLKKSLAAGSLPTENDFQKTMTNVTYDPKAWATAQDLAGKELKRTVGVGHTLTLEDLIERSAVRLGQQVQILINKKAFSVELTGVAQKSGRLGEKIPVRILQTKKNVSAEVIADGQVRL